MVTDSSMLTSVYYRISAHGTNIFTHFDQRHMTDYSTLFFFLMMRPPPISPLFPSTPLFRFNIVGADFLFRDRDRLCRRRRHQIDRPRPDHPRHRRAVRAAAHPSSLVDADLPGADRRRSEEHTSELQSQSNLVCRLLLETKNN